MWLLGANQVPPVQSDAFGFALFRVAPDESAIDYWHFVANLENAEESHVHKGPPDFNVHTTAHPAGEIHGQIRSLDA